MSLKQALVQITAIGYQGKRTAFEVYCRNLVTELGISYRPRRNVAGAVIKHDTKPIQHCISKTDLLRHLWSGKELDQGDLGFIYNKYPIVLDIQQCICDFRRIFEEKSIPLLEQFIKQYAQSHSIPLKSFASGLRADLDAVKNSVIYNLSNGFVEGNNNKIKAIKRTMYGRAKIDLLRIKVLYAR